MPRDLTERDAHDAMARIVPLGNRRLIRQAPKFWPEDPQGWALVKVLFWADVALIALLAWEIYARHK